MIHSRCVSRKTSSILEQDLLHKLSYADEFRIVYLSDLNLHSLPEFLIKNSDKVEHLILDENELDEDFLEDVSFPNLKTLSLNSNKISNIGVLLQQISWKCPNLVFLSLIGNPGWPHPVVGNNVTLYKNSIQTVSKFLPKLQFLDSIPTVFHRA